MPKRILTAALALCFAAAAPAATTAQQTPAARPDSSKSDAPKPDPAKPAPVAEKAGFQVAELDEAGLAKLIKRDAAAPAERRPLLVNFWATWCDPCRDEMPDLVKIEEDFRARGMDFALVSLDDVAELAKGVPEFLTQMRATRIPSYLLNANDPEAAINSVDPKWRGELPATFIFDREGRLAYKHTGRIKPAELRKALEAALGPAAGAQTTGAN